MDGRTDGRTAQLVCDWGLLWKSAAGGANWIEAIIQGAAVQLNWRSLPAEHLARTYLGCPPARQLTITSELRIALLLLGGSMKYGATESVFRFRFRFRFRFGSVRFAAPGSDGRRGGWELNSPLTSRRDE